MDRVKQQVVFIIDGEAFYWQDVFLFGFIRGDWEWLLSDLRLALKLIKIYNNEGNLNLTDDIKSALDKFRYQRDLESKQETLTWLKKRHLSFDELVSFITRQVVRERGLVEHIDLELSESGLEDEIRQAIYPEGVLSGEFAGWLESFAGYASFFDRNDVPRNSKSASRIVSAEGFPTFVHCLKAESISTAEWGERASLIQHLMAKGDAYLDEHLDRDEISKVVSQHELDWTWVDYNLALFSDENAAKEALFCLKEGCDLIRLALEAKASLKRLAHFLENSKVLEPQAKRVAMAKKGDVIGPIKSEEGYAICMINKKELPSLGKGEVSLMARERLRARIFRELMSERIEWKASI